MPKATQGTLTLFCKNQGPSQNASRKQKVIVDLGLSIVVLLQGDLIISVTHLIEALTIVTDYTKKPEIIEIVDTRT